MLTRKRFLQFQRSWKISAAGFDANKSTVRTNIIAYCVNDPSKKHYRGSGDDRFFKVGPGKYRKLAVGESLEDVEPLLETSQGGEKMVVISDGDRLAMVLENNEDGIADIFESLENKIKELGVFNDYLGDGWDIALFLEAYDSDGEEKLKLVIDIEDDEIDFLDDEVIEGISDTITDRLRDKYSDDFEEMGIDLYEDLDWSPVQLNVDMDD